MALSLEMMKIIEKNTESFIKLPFIFLYIKQVENILTNNHILYPKNAKKHGFTFGSTPSGVKKRSFCVKRYTRCGGLYILTFFSGGQENDVKNCR